MAAQRPLLVVFEDVHWIDPTSKELLENVVDGTRDAPVLVLITLRPEGLPISFGQANVTALTMSRLSDRQSATLIAGLTGGQTLPAELVEQIVAKTDGIPLFIEELTKAVLESGLVAIEGDRYVLARPLTDLAIPDTLHDSLTARLDRLGPVKEVAQIAAVIGREFSYELLAAVAELPEDELQSALRQLCAAELVFGRGQPPDAVYAFKHVLVQETAYNAVLRERRAELHGRIAHTLAADFPEILENRPELIAQHCTEAGLDEEAVEFWREAGELAIARSAAHEAVAHLQSALRHPGQVSREPSPRPDRARPADQPRRRADRGQELRGARRPAGRSCAPGSCASGRRREPPVPGAVRALDPSHIARAELDLSLAVAGDLMRLAEAAGRSRAADHRPSGARQQPVLHRRSGGGAHARRAGARWLCSRRSGPISRSATPPTPTCSRPISWRMRCSASAIRTAPRPHAANALARARELGHVLTMAHALHHDCLFHQLARDGQAVRQQADALISARGRARAAVLAGVGPDFPRLGLGRGRPGSAWR